MISRGQIHWADLGPPRGSAPAKRRPVVVVQSNRLNQSRLGTVVVASVTSNTALARIPGNVFLPSRVTGLPQDSVVNVTQVTAVDRSQLEGAVGSVPEDLMSDVANGLRSVLAL